MTLDTDKDAWTCCMCGEELAANRAWCGGGWYGKPLHSHVLKPSSSLPPSPAGERLSDAEMEHIRKQWTRLESWQGAAAGMEPAIPRLLGHIDALNRLLHEMQFAAWQAGQKDITTPEDIRKSPDELRQRAFDTRNAVADYVARLRTSLQTYGQHKEGCPKLSWPHRPCDKTICGFDAVLSELGERP